MKTNAKNECSPRSQCYMLNVFFGFFWGGGGVKIYCHKHCQACRNFAFKSSLASVSCKSDVFVCCFLFLTFCFFVILSFCLYSFAFKFPSASVSASVSSNSDGRGAEEEKTQLGLMQLT